MTLANTIRTSSLMASALRPVTVCARCQSTQVSPASAPTPQVQVPKTSYKLEDCNARRQQIQEMTGVDLNALGGWWDGVVPAQTSDLHRSIQQPCGMARLPIAAVGPLQFQGEAAQGPILLPMATTEGALVASVQRGCTAINMSGGVTTKTGAQRMTKSPMFMTQSPQQASRLGEWVKDNKARIQSEVINSIANNARLTGILDGQDLHVAHILFQIETGDEAGQQTAALCSAAISQWVMETVKKEVPDSHIQITSYFSEGGMCAAKKSSALNVATGRGMHTTAECFISEHAFNKVLKTTSETMETFMKYAERNSARAGMFSLSTNPVNVVAANFAATGNDISSVGEAVNGSNLTFSRVDGGMNIKFNFPSLVVGTVGGATALPTQAASLDMMGCSGEGKVRRFAEVLAGYCIALDVSTLSAISAHQFAQAHDRLGRNRPDEKK